MNIKFLLPCYFGSCMLRRLIIIFIAFFILGIVILLFSQYTTDNFRAKLYNDYVNVTREQIKTLEGTLEINPDEPTTYYYISLAYWHIDEVDKAIEYSMLGVEKFPDYAPLKMLLGEYYVGTGNIEEANALKELLDKEGFKTEAQKLQQTIDDPTRVPPRGKKNILFPD